MKPSGTKPLQVEIGRLISRKKALKKLDKVWKEVECLFMETLEGSAEGRDIRLIMTEVAAAYEIEMTWLCGDSRRREICRPRMMVFYLILELRPKISRRRVAGWFGVSEGTLRHAHQRMGNSVYPNERDRVRMLHDRLKEEFEARDAFPRAAVE